MTRNMELHIDGPPTPVGVTEGVRIRAHGALRRRAFGLNWDPAFAAGGLVFDDRVELLLDVVAVRHAAAVSDRS
jgi:polyisoprenoid-binding protein YceI